MYIIKYLYFSPRSGRGRCHEVNVLNIANFELLDVKFTISISGISNFTGAGAEM